MLQGNEYFCFFCEYAPRLLIASTGKEEKTHTKVANCLKVFRLVSKGA